MDSYTITIAPNDDSGNSTTLIVDTSGEQVCITDVRLHAARGLTGGQMPTVDFGLLLRAVATTAVSPTPIEATPAATPAGPDAQAPAVADEAAAPSEAEPPTAVAPKPRRAKRTPAADPTPEPAARPRARRAPAATSAGVKATKAGAKRGGGATATAGKRSSRKTAAPAPTGGRVYRRMPEDFTAVYQQAGTAAAIADHYGVPRHTAQGWIRRVKSTNATTGG
jgi:pyruvate/2-oxoglutarate dehydrogenase complex dihydrolipoamide acyltransferase (E2) component